MQVNSSKQDVQRMKKYLDPKAYLAFKEIFGELEELLDNPETSKALETVEEAAMTKSELLAYDDFWDKVGAERLLFIDSNKISREKGFAKGRAVGLEEGRQEGRQEGREEARAEMVRLMLAKGMSLDQIAFLTDLSLEAVRALIGQNVEK